MLLLLPCSLNLRIYACRYVYLCMRSVLYGTRYLKNLIKPFMHCAKVFIPSCLSLFLILIFFLISCRIFQDISFQKASKREDQKKKEIDSIKKYILYIQIHIHKRFLLLIIAPFLNQTENFKFLSFTIFFLFLQFSSIMPFSK